MARAPRDTSLADAIDALLAQQGGPYVMSTGPDGETVVSSRAPLPAVDGNVYQSMYEKRSGRGGDRYVTRLRNLPAPAAPRAPGVAPAVPTMRREEPEEPEEPKGPPSAPPAVKKRGSGGGAPKATPTFQRGLTSRIGDAAPAPAPASEAPPRRGGRRLAVSSASAGPVPMGPTRERQAPGQPRAMEPGDYRLRVPDLARRAMAGPAPTGPEPLEVARDLVLRHLRERMQPMTSQWNRAESVGKALFQPSPMGRSPWDALYEILAGYGVVGR